MLYAYYFGTVLYVLSMVAFGMPHIPVIANVRGKRYNVDAESVEDVCKSVEEQAGLESGQYSVLFRGKVLNPADDLEEIGVSSGDTLNIVKGKRSRAVRTSESGESETELDGVVTNNESATSGMPMNMNMDSYKKALESVDPKELENAMKSLDDVLDSGMLDEYLVDDEKLEALRLQMLGSADQYDSMMPGMKDKVLEIASDPIRWKEAMHQARDQIANLRQLRDQGKFNKPSSNSPPSDSVDDADGEDV